MIKTIDFAGIRLDNYTVRETILNVEKKLADTGFHTIEEVNMDTLMLAEQDETVRRALASVEYTVIAENGILEAVGASSYQRRHEIEHHDFFYEMLKRMERGRRTVFIIGDTAEHVGRVRQFFAERCAKCEVVGAEAMEECDAADAMVNEVNALAPDVIFCVLPSPTQESFLLENQEKLSAKLWYGVGAWDFSAQKPGFFGRLKKKLYTYRLGRRLDHYNGNRAEGA